MENIRRPLYLLLTGMIISAVILLISAGKAVRTEKSIAAARQAAYQERKPVGFVLKEYQGHLALYRENAPAPYCILDSEVWLLPEEDRLALEEGILVENEQALKALLEDWDE